MFQVGTAQVTGNPPSKITVTSSDGFAQPYQLNAQTTVNGQLNGISSIKPKDEVQVIADGSNTAIRITDITGLKASGSHFGFGPGSFPGQRAGGPRTAVAGAF
jgi:hypothetical protein